MTFKKLPRVAIANTERNTTPDTTFVNLEVYVDLYSCIQFYITHSNHNQN